MISHKPLCRALLALLLVALSSLSGAAERLSVRFEGIADGDTIYVQSADGRVSYRVRLAAIDAPEKKQAYGAQAKGALTQLLRGADRLDLDVHDTDRYGRLIAVIHDGRGRNVNLALVAQGAAWVYHQYARQPSYRQLYPALVNAERTAKVQRLGLWRDDNPVEPWRFRRSK